MYNSLDDPLGFNKAPQSVMSDGISYSTMPTNLTSTEPMSVAGSAAYNYTPSGSVLDASDSNSGGGGNNNNNNNEPSQDNYLQQLYAEIDRIYGDTMGHLGNQESMLRANQPTVEADIEGQYQGSQKTLQTEKTAGERTIEESKTGAGQIFENALTSGRNLFNELVQGGQQRWGEVSSAGEAYKELAGREFQRGQATAHQAYQTAVTKIQNLQANLQERYDSAMYNLEVQKNSAINEARRSFQEQLLNIDAMRLQANENKSQMRLQLLQDLRNQVYQINLASAQTSQALAQQQKQSEAELQSMLSQIASVNTGAQEANNTQALSMASYQPTDLSVSGGGEQVAYNPTGSIKKKDEYLV